MYVLEEIVAGARMHLTANGYSKSTISHYETVWGRLSQWCVANAPDGYDRGVERRYLKETGLTSSRLTKQQRFVRRAVERLIEVAEAGAPSKPVPVRKYHVPAGLMPAYRLYKAELSCRGLKAVTVDSYLSTVRHFLFACGVSKPEELIPLSLTVFSSSMSGQSPQTKAGKLYVVRDLARTLADHGMCDPSVAASMPLIPGHKHASVPSAYTAGEVSALLGAEPTGRCPLRTRAMLLLASVLGMRVGDMRALRTDDVDWRAKTLTFVQSKTGVAQVLPMPDEVWLALADHLALADVAEVALGEGRGVRALPAVGDLLPLGLRVLALPEDLREGLLHLGGRVVRPLRLARVAHERGRRQERAERRRHDATA